MEKQVILSKSEYDSMEKELDQLKSVVENKTITKIFVPEHLGTSYGLVFRGYTSTYVFGVDESEVIKEIKEEIEKVRKERDDYSKKVFDQYKEILLLKEEKDSWMKLNWLKRLFKIRKLNV